LLITDGSRIRQITPGGIISTVAGNGTYGYSGDGGPATKATLNYPQGVFGDSIGNIYIADSNNYVVRKVNPQGIIQTVAGNHTPGFSGDGGPATSASLSYVFSVVADGKGNFYIADGNERVRIVNPAGIINTYAGNGTYGDTGSGGPATSASIGMANGLLLGDGKLYISAQVIWAVDLSTQIINITAGNGNVGFNGDGNTALSTSFSNPNGMAFNSAGALLVVDSGNARLRQIASNQIVSHNRRRICRRRRKSDGRQPESFQLPSSHWVRPSRQFVYRRWRQLPRAKSIPCRRNQHVCWNWHLWLLGRQRPRNFSNAVLAGSGRGRRQWQRLHRGHGQQRHPESR
jgi:hypothetical protein